MKQETVQVGTHRYILAQGHDIADVKASAVAAVRAGGGIVDLVVHGGEEVSFLLSPGVAVLFTTEVFESRPEETGEPWPPFASYTDVEFI